MVAVVHVRAGSGPAASLELPDAVADLAQARKFLGLRPCDGYFVLHDGGAAATTGKQAELPDSTPVASAKGLELVIHPSLLPGL